MSRTRYASRVGGAGHDRPAAGEDPAAGAADRGGPRATLGCVQLPTDLTLDEEGPALVARVPGVRLRLQKLTLPGERLDRETYAHARGTLAPAARTLRPVGSLDAVGLACTSLACTLGRESVQAELREGQPGARTTDMASALLAALERLGLRRVAWLSPYLEELDAAVLGLLEEAGIEVVQRRALGLETDAAISAIPPAELSALALAQDHPDASGLVLACSAFRACGPGFLDDLEARLGKPVVASQQAFLWHLLRTAGVEDAVPGYGQLFRLPIDPGPTASPTAAPTASPTATGDRRTARDAPAASPAGPDPYPSRVPDPGLVPRRDPVVARGARGAGPLGATQLAQFERDGVLVLRGVFGADEVRRLATATADLRRQHEARASEERGAAGDPRVVTERAGARGRSGAAGAVVKTLWQVHLPAEHAPHLGDAAPLLRRTACDSRLVDVARQLLGEPVYVHQSRVNYQRGLRDDGEYGLGFLWHQDFEQWHAEDGMPRMRAVSMAVLLDPAVHANGALMVLPGSHRELVQAHADDAAPGAARASDLARGPRLPAAVLRRQARRFGIEHCTGRPGDVLLFDCNVLHGSHSNISPWDRRMVFVVYNALSNTPAERPFAAPRRRPEHLGSHDPRFAGVPLPSLCQDLARPGTSSSLDPAPRPRR